MLAMNRPLEVQPERSTRMDNCKALDPCGWLPPKSSWNDPYVQPGLLYSGGMRGEDGLWVVVSPCWFPPQAQEGGFRALPVMCSSVQWGLLGSQ